MNPRASFGWTGREQSPGLPCGDRNLAWPDTRLARSQDPDVVDLRRGLETAPSPGTTSRARQCRDHTPHLPQANRDHPAWSLGKDLNVISDQFRDYAMRAARNCQETRDRTWADFVAAFGCEATVGKDGRIQDTALRTMSGAGHQHFLQFMSLIVNKTTAAHLEKTLFQPWRYDDPVEKSTLRRDPIDDVRLATMARSPAATPSTREGQHAGCKSPGHRGSATLTDHPSQRCTAHDRLFRPR